jgi:hypothetical protein
MAYGVRTRGPQSFHSSLRTGKPSTRAWCPWRRDAGYLGTGSGGTRDAESHNGPAPYPGGELESRMRRKSPVRFGRGPGEKAELSDLACGLPYPGISRA